MSDNTKMHFCAGPSCPGLPWPASVMRHPIQCAQPASDVEYQQTPTPPAPDLRARVEGVLTKLREWAEDEPVFSEAADLLEAAIKGDSP